MARMIFVMLLSMVIGTGQVMAAEWQKVQLPTPPTNLIKGRSLLACEIKNLDDRFFYACRVGVSTPAPKADDKIDYWVVELDKDDQKKQEWVIKNISTHNNLFSAAIIAADAQDFYLAVAELDHEMNKKYAQQHTLSSWAIKTLKTYRVSKNNRQEAIDYGYIKGSLANLPAIILHPTTVGRKISCLWVFIQRPSEASDNQDGDFFEIVEQCPYRQDKERLRIVTTWKESIETGKWYEPSFINYDGTLTVGALELQSGKVINEVGINLWEFSHLPGNPMVWEQMGFQKPVQKKYAYANPIPAHEIANLQTRFFIKLPSATERLQRQLVVPQLVDHHLKLLIRTEPVGDWKQLSDAEWPVTITLDVSQLILNNSLEFTTYPYINLFSQQNNSWLLTFFHFDHKNASSTKGSGYISMMQLDQSGKLSQKPITQQLNRSDRSPMMSQAQLALFNSQTVFLLLNETVQNNRFSLWRLHLGQ